MEALLSSCLGSDIEVIKCTEERVQTLWAGYGLVVRLKLQIKRAGKEERGENKSVSVILKRVSPPADEDSVSHRRKLKSYEVEAAFYAPNGSAMRFLIQQEHDRDQGGDDDDDDDGGSSAAVDAKPSSPLLRSPLNTSSTIPYPFSVRKGAAQTSTTNPSGHTKRSSRGDNPGHDERAHHVELILSDLCDASPPFSGDGIGGEEGAKAVLRWLACFHACFWGRAPDAGLWEEGSYWHLQTRWDEYNDMDLRRWKRLHAAAKAIDRRLSGFPRDGHTRSLKHRCLVHGDPKGENIMFAGLRRGEKKRKGGSKGGQPKEAKEQQRDREGGVTCALYDFQYVGGGYGSRDLAYALCSSFPQSLLDDGEEGGSTVALLRHYHSLLLDKLQRHCPEELAVHPFGFGDLLAQFDLAMADYVRFMAGWGMWGDHRWATRWAEKVLCRLDNGRLLGEAEYMEAVYREYPL